MAIITRQMRPEEARKVQKIAQHSFEALEGLGVPKPKQAIVAVSGDDIVGAIQYKCYRAGGKKIGYFDYAFIAPGYRNQGIGGMLYKATTDFLWEQGCDAQTALVKDDNVGSWGLFLKNGFTRASLPELMKTFGPLGTFRLYFGTLFGIAVGMDYYVALRERKFPDGKGGSGRQIIGYLSVNLLLSLLLLFSGGSNSSALLASYLVFLVGGVIFGYVGTLFSTRRWHFRLCNGGAAVCALVNLKAGVLPMAGSWYPESYQNTNAFRRDMGIQALTGWVFVLLLTLFSTFMSEQHIFLRYLNQMGAILLLYRVFPIYPFEFFGSRRVYRWNRGIYFLMAALSLVLFTYHSIR